MLKSTNPVEALFSRTAAGILPGLETTRRVLAQLNQPQQTFPGIHVAGTNGKGSVCAMLERLLAAHGLITGCYTSPHLVDLGERFRINGQPLPEAEVLKLIEEVTEADAASIGDDRRATFFECTTAMAFECFRQKGVQAAVVETGLGGRWDATNVFQPQATVITSIGMDHQAYLGETLEAIAGEKAGIIKPGIPVVIAAQHERVMPVLLEQARKVNAPVLPLDQAASVQLLDASTRGLKLKLETHTASYGTLTLPLCGKHQAPHAALAVLAAEAWMESFGAQLDPALVKKAFTALRWPARMDVVLRDPPFIVDGAHNEPAARCLADALSDLVSGPGFWVLGMMEDKDLHQVLHILKPKMAAVAVVAVEEARACPAHRLAALAKQQGIDATAMSLDDACRWAWQQAGEQGGYACLAGSIHLAGAFYQGPFARENNIRLEWVS